MSLAAAVTGHVTGVVLGAVAALALGAVAWRHRPALPLLAASAVLVIGSLVGAVGHGSQATGLASEGSLVERLLPVAELGRLLAEVGTVGAVLAALLGRRSPAAEQSQLVARTGNAARTWSHAWVIASVAVALMDG